MKMTEKDKIKQMNKEALLSIGLYILFFLWWYGFAYGLGLKDPSEYQYIIGLPSWFFYSSVLGYIVISFANWIMVKKFFVEIPLDDEDKDEVLG